MDNSALMSSAGTPIWWTFGYVPGHGFVPKKQGMGTTDYMRQFLHDNSLKVAYMAYEGEADKPKQCLYVGMGKPQRPIWQYSGSARVKCNMFFGSKPEAVFTIEVLVMSANWVKISVFENFLGTTLKPRLNSRVSRLTYNLEDYKDSQNLWDSEYVDRFGHLMP